jgi:hypothetical protein
VASRNWFHVDGCALSEEAEKTFFTLGFFGRHIGWGGFEVIARMDHLVNHTPIRDTTQVTVIDKEVCL